MMILGIKQVTRSLRVKLIVILAVMKFLRMRTKERLHLVKRNPTALTVVRKLRKLMISCCGPASNAEVIFIESVLIRWVALTVVKNARCNGIIQEID
jgi:hypothetical protein